MTAICKTIAIHGKTVSPLVKYCGEKEKVSVSMNIENIEALLNYGSDPLKTICGIDEDHKELLVSGIKCTPETAAEEFALTKERYLSLKGSTEEFDKNYDESKGKAKRQPVIAIHLIQSFAETDIDPRVAHEIGVRLAESVGCQAVVDTHMNRDHIHNHIILNSYMDHGRKVAMNKDFILNMREISDDLQREYGIPVEFENPRDQLRHKARGTISRKEWDMMNEGLSWKDQMRADIASIAEIAQNREEYLQLMESYGYIAEKVTPKYATFRVVPLDKKISDKKLGDEYTIGVLYPINKEKEKDERIREAQKRRSYTPFMGKPISVARYDSNGRRRGLLEMLIRKAIAIIQRVGNFFFDDRSNSSKYQSPKYKIDMLNEGIDIIRKHDVQSAADLENKIAEAGSKVSHAKRNLRIAEIEKNMVDAIDSALTDIEMLSVVKTSVGDLHLHDYTKEEVLKERAKVAPMTSKQRKDLSRQLGLHHDMRLTCRFDEISCSDAEKLLNYFNKKATERPEILLTDAEYKKRNIEKQMDSIYERQLERLRDKYKDVPPKEVQLKQAMKILESKGISIDPNALSQYDVLSIRNSFSENPFSSPRISDAQLNLLQNKVKELGLVTNRDLQYVTASEFNQFMRYVDGKTKAVPSFIGDREEPSANDVQKLAAFMNVKGIEVTIPISSLSKTDFNKLYSHVICNGHIPEVLDPIDNQSNIEKDNLFYARVSEYNMSRSLHLSQIRNAYNTLRSFGFNVEHGDDLTEIRAMVDEWEKSFDEIEKEKEDLSKKYSELIKLKQISKKAASPSFLYGDLFDPEVDKEIPVEEREERDTRSEEEDKRYRQREKEVEEPSR